MKFGFIASAEKAFPVAAMCRVFSVTRQGYYAYLKRQTAKRPAEVELQAQIRQAYAEGRGAYGSPRVVAALRNKGVPASKRRVERTMRALGLQGRKRRRFRVTTQANPAHPVAANLLDRNFTADRPNQRWVTDISYVWTDEGWCYLAVILDLFSRAVVGWALDTTLTTQLPLRALDMAVRRRVPGSSLLHHSDRGCQYTSQEYRRALDDLGIDVSMSRKGNCWDNAVAESFFSTIKAELVHDRRWVTRLELRAAVFEYIEVFYNRQRLHSTLGYKSPIQFEIDNAAVAA
jgi:transposase InsO family protein